MKVLLLVVVLAAIAFRLAVVTLMPHKAPADEVRVDPGSDGVEVQADGKEQR